MKYKFVLLTFALFILNSNVFANELVCDSKKNLTYYADMDESDEYWNYLGPEKHLNNLSDVLKNFSIITNNFEDNGSFEFAFNEDGTLSALDFNTCEEEILKWKFQYEPYEGTFKILAGFNDTSEYLIKFGLLGSSHNYYKLTYYQQGTQDCHNEMNPICHKLLAEVDIIGYNYLKNDLTYTEQRKILVKKIETEKKKKKEAEERLIAEKKAEEERLKRERLEREKAEEERLERERLEREKAYLKKEKFDNSPYGQLFNAYSSYLMIKDLYEARKDYAIQYVSSNRLSEVRKKIKEIETKITSENDINGDKVWSAASQSYKDEFSSSMNLIKSTGVYNDSASGLAKLQLYTFDNLYSDIIGNIQIEKDF